MTDEARLLHELLVELRGFRATTENYLNNIRMALEDRDGDDG